MRHQEINSHYSQVTWYFTQKAQKNLNKLLQLTNEFSKVTSYKVSLPKSIAFLYTNKRKTRK